MNPERLEQQIEFIRETEKLKTVFRKNMVIDRTRPENSAEHSWHVALMALVLGEYANDSAIDLRKVLTMLLIHDLVEIDGGDTWLYDNHANAQKADKEQSCAERIFALLPADQATGFMALWQEFEAGETPEARFAGALDAMHPLINHQVTGGELIRGAHIPARVVIDKKSHIAKGAQDLWTYARGIIAAGVRSGLYVDDPE